MSAPSPTDYAARATAYAREIVSGARPACRWTRLAAQRHLRDLDRQGAPDLPFTFEPVYANHICTFIEQLPHVEGECATRGESLRLDDWQVFALACLNGWRIAQANGRSLRRFRRSYIAVPRKNGKSTLMAALGLYFLAVDGEAGPKVFSAATSSDQARIVFDVANAMAHQGVVRPPSGAMRLADVLGLRVEQHKILVERDRAAVFRPLPSQTKSRDGKNPHLAIVDELHEHETAELWNSLASALGARAQPLLIAITTAGWNVSGICYEVESYLKKVLAGDLRDDAFFGIVYGVDDGDDAGDPVNWAKANPGLGTAKSISYLRDEWNTAKASQLAMGEFLRKHLNIWTSVGASAFDLDAITRAIDPSLTRADFAGCRGMIGVDLSVKHDLTSVIALLAPDARRIAFGVHFATQEQIGLPGNDHLAAWAREGKLRICPGARIDQEMVEEAILELYSAFDIEEIVFDPHFAEAMMLRLSNQDYPVTEFRQKPLELSAPIEELQALIANGRLVTDGDPVLYWMMANAIIHRNGDFMRLRKAEDSKKIDGVAALVNAVGRMIAVDTPPPPTYLAAADLMVF